MMRVFVLSVIVICSCNSNTKRNALPPSTPPIQVDSTVYVNNSFQSLIDEYEDPGRSRWQNPALVLDKLGNVQQKKVADIGAGTGYFTFRMAERGADVLAIDIEQQFLNYIEDRRDDLGETMEMGVIETRLAQAEDPHLNPNEVDIILMVNTYHFIENRISYLEKLEPALRPAGKLFIVDYKPGKFPIGPTEDLKVSIDNLRTEVQAAGLAITEIDTSSLDYQYIIVVNKE